MLLTETKIPDTVYCQKLLGYDVVCSETTVTVAGGPHWGCLNGIAGITRGVDFRVNVLPRAECGELQGCFRRSENVSNCGISITFNHGTLTRPGRRAEPLHRQG